MKKDSCCAQLSVIIKDYTFSCNYGVMKRASINPDVRFIKPNRYKFNSTWQQARNRQTPDNSWNELFMSRADCNVLTVTRATRINNYDDGSVYRKIKSTDSRYITGMKTDRPDDLIVKNIWLC